MYLDEIDSWADLHGENDHPTLKVKVTFRVTGYIDVPDDGWEKTENKLIDRVDSDPDGLADDVFAENDWEVDNVEFEFE